MKKWLVTALGRIGLLWQQPGMTSLIYLNFLLIALQSGIILSFGHFLPPLIPLFYSRPWGQSQLTNPSSLFLLPGLSFLTLVLNSGLTIIFFKETVFPRLYLWTSNLFAFLILLTLLRLFLNFLF